MKVLGVVKILGFRGTRYHEEKRLVINAPSKLQLAINDLNQPLANMSLTRRKSQIHQYEMKFYKPKLYYIMGK